MEGDAATDARRALVRRHMRPQPRIAAGRAAATAGVRCGIDVSDGLVQDLGHVCRASGVAAEIYLDRVPLDPSLVAEFPADAQTLVLTGGEDYELLLIAPEELLVRVSETLDTPLTVIGRVVDGEPGVRVIDPDGREVTVDRGGWDHLKRE
jgi:thiamine-monophosphate kinase